MPAPNVLQKLVGKAFVREFIERYWEQRPYLARRRNDLLEIVSMPMIEECIRSSSQVGITASFDGGDTLVPIERNQYREAHNSGGTICVNGLQRANPILRDLALGLRADLGHAGNVSVRCYMSPDGRGYDTHFDARIATIVQLEGSKEWWFSPVPAVEFPHIQTACGGKRGIEHTPISSASVLPWQRFGAADEASFRRVVLRPGDVLMLPAGTWHRARAIGHSVALNIAFDAYTFHALISRVLWDLLSENTAWRQSLPLWRYDRDGSSEEIGRFIEARTRELRELLSTDRGRDEILRSWEQVLGGSPGEANLRSPRSRTGVPASGR